MKLIIAGPGAGKTSNLAELVFDKSLMRKNKKWFFIITFTNQARNVILNKINSKPKFQVPKVSVSTIHSFFLNEIIFPYHHFLYSKKFYRATSIELPNDTQFRSIRLSQLRNQNYIHNTEVSKYSKYIIVGKKSDSKEIKLIRQKIHSILQSYISDVFIDEAQDIDLEMSEIFTTFQNLGIEITLIGDPKQNIQSKTGLKRLTETELPEFIRDNHRSPQSHVEMLNQFTSPKEKQIWHSKVSGELHLVRGDNAPFENVLDKKWDLIYIYEKHAEFITKPPSNRYQLFFDALLIICAELKIHNPEKISFEILRKVRNDSSFGKSECRNFLKSITKQIIPNKIWHSIGDAFSSLGFVSNTESYIINSIDSIKGCEGEYCLFILTTDVIKHLYNPCLPFDKCKAKLYVALSRSIKNLTVYLPVSITKQYKMEDLVSMLESYGFSDQTQKYISNMSN